MKITITTIIDFTATSASAQTSLSPMPSHAPATDQSSSAATASESPGHPSQALDESLPFAECIPRQTSDVALQEAAWVRLAEQGRLATLLDTPTLTPEEFDRCQKAVLAALEAEARLATPPGGPPPPPAPVGSPSSENPSPGDFRYKANVERFYAAL